MNTVFQFFPHLNTKQDELIGQAVICNLCSFQRKHTIGYTVVLVGTWLSTFPLMQIPVSVAGSGFWMFLLSALYSHNSKTTTWLDPRLAKKAKPPEKCEDGGKASGPLQASGA